MIKSDKRNPKGPGKNVKKADLPVKTCPVCNRSFSWRKKWTKTWEEVKYCSEGCKKKK